MSTSYEPIPQSAIPAPRRAPLRLHMADHPGRNQLDGGWWPQSRDLAVELADLVDHFPRQLGRIVRALYSPPDWDPAPRRIPVADGFVKVGYFPSDDTHVIQLKTADRNVLSVLVVPPGCSDDQGAEALLAAATSGNRHPATELLDTVTEYPDVDPLDHWSDDGGSCWDSPPVAPTSRSAT
jgi:hypothetical protein